MKVASSLKPTQQKMRVLAQLSQPLTVTQLSRRVQIHRDRCTSLLRVLVHEQLARCLTPSKARQRVYGLTHTGQAMRARLTGHRYESLGLRPKLLSFGSSRHRSATIKALTTEPATTWMIRRRARFADPQLCMSMNNLRGVLYCLERHDLAQRSQRGRHHPRWALTAQGADLQLQLFKAETRWTEQAGDSPSSREGVQRPTGREFAVDR